MRTIKLSLILSAALLTIFVMTSVPSFSQVSVGVAVSFAPPDLPVYDQPPCPGDDYIWTPGYWSYDYDEADYYWVPGTWILAPEPGFFWTPGYWAWRDTGFFWNAGYWGPVVGFYGGVNYGFGYFGHGYEGGRWDRGHFYYNRSVTNVNVTVVRNVYNTTVVNNNVTVNRVSFNGGNGGISARANAQEEAAARERHIPPVATQTQHVQEARSDRQLRAKVNNGRPPVAATEKPNAFKGNGVVAAKEAGALHNEGARPGNNNARPENNNSARPENNARPNNAIHPRDLPPAERGPAPNTGNAKVDQKYQKQQESLAAKQDKDRQKLQQRQEKEDQRVQKQQADEARKQQTEQRHQQQTQKMEQKHEQQRQTLQTRQQPRPAAQAKPQEPKKH